MDMHGADSNVYQIINRECSVNCIPIIVADW